MSESDHIRLDDGRPTRLALAVQLVDAFSGRAPSGDPDVRLVDVDTAPVRTPSGYYVFTDLDPGTRVLEVTGHRRYLDVRRPGVRVVDPTSPDTDLDPSDPETLPIETVPLDPAPPYQFPADATRVRGTVRGPDGAVVPDATVTLRVQAAPEKTSNGDPSSIDRSTRTTDAGEFVLFLAASETPAVDTGDGSLSGPDGHPVIEVTHPSFGTVTTTVHLQEGELLVHDLELS